MYNVKKTVIISLNSGLVNTCFYSISVAISKFPWFAVNYWYKKELCFVKKDEFLKIWQSNFNKEESNQNVQ